MSGSGDDVLNVGGFHDVVDGGGGTDVLQLADAARSYVLVSANGQTTLAGPRESVTFSNIETFRFLDREVPVAGLGAAVAAFDALSYVASYADLRVAFGADAAAGTAHFLQSGVVEGRRAGFDALSYIASYADLRATLGDDSQAGARHYILFGAAEGRASAFDAARYIASNPDLIVAFGTDIAAAERHYIRFGAAEGRTASFDALRYIASNPDLIAAFGADVDRATRHYIEHGYAEGRRMDFDPLAYGAGYTDLARAIVADPAALARHYIDFGRAEGRRPDPGFDAVAYLLSYSDLQQAHLGADGALHHWLTNGADEGREGQLFFGNDQTDHRLSNNQTVQDGIGYIYDKDWFAFTAEAGQSVQLDLTGVALRGAMDVSAGDGIYVGGSGTTLIGPGATHSHFAFTADRTGTYYVAVHVDYSAVSSPGGFGSGGVYDLSLHIV